MIRAHETAMRGCRLHFGSLWTVFSHPRYLSSDNAAGTLTVGADGSFQPRMFLAPDAQNRAMLEAWPQAAEDEEPDVAAADEESLAPDGLSQVCNWVVRVTRTVRPVDH